MPIPTNDWYTIQSGDTLSKIAKEAGIADWKTIYNDPKNADFRKKCPNPDKINIGEKIWIPEKLKTATGKKTVFVAPAVLPATTIQIKAEDGTNNPISILEKGSKLKFKANASPAGGTFKWTVTGKVSIVGTDTNETVEIKGDDTSSGKEDSTVTVKYTANGKDATDTSKLTVITVSISPASMHVTESENSAAFTVNVQPAGLPITTYRWLSGHAEGAWPASAGNNPKLDYSAPKGASTIVRSTRWFAPTPSRHISIDGQSCTYKINCEVTVNGKKFKAATAADMEVEVENFSGTTPWPQFQNWNSVIIAQDAAGVWKVTAKGGFSRTVPVATVDTLATSQFYNKVWEHENLHVQQWTRQNPWQNLFNADTLYNTVIRGLTSNISAADLRAKIWTAVRAQNATDATTASNTMCQREKAAWNHENTIAPDFLELTEADWKAAYGCP